MVPLPFSPFPDLTTPRLVLRQMSDRDTERLFQLRSDPTVNKFIGRKLAEELPEATAFISRINGSIKSGSTVYWAICLRADSELIGTICLWNFSGDTRVAELGYELMPSFQGQGIMDEAVKLVLNFASAELKLEGLEAFTHKENLPSIHLLERNHFQLDSQRKDPENEDNLIFTIKLPLQHG